MLAKQIKIGGIYTAKVSGKLTSVRVVDIREVTRSMGYGSRTATVYDCINVATGRGITVRSPQRFRSEVAAHV